MKRYSDQYFSVKKLDFLDPHQLLLTYDLNGLTLSYLGGGDSSSFSQRSEKVRKTFFKNARSDRKSTAPVWHTPFSNILAYFSRISENSAISGFLNYSCFQELNCQFNSDIQSIQESVVKATY